MASALETVQRFYPNVVQVIDAKHDTRIEVTKTDSQSADVRNHKQCALAVACKRKHDADGVIISLSSAYIVKGRTATRYKVPQSVAREIVSFDRNGGFSEGEYQLSKPGDGQKLGSFRGESTYNKKRTKSNKRFRHMTENVRHSLLET